MNKSTQRTIHRKTRCKETFANGQIQRRKGKVTTSPKVKVKVKAKLSGKGHRNQDQTGSPDEETGQRSLDDFGMKLQRVEFVGDIQENDDFETPRVDRAALCVLRSKVQECNDGFNGELPSSSTRVFFRQGSEGPVALMKRNLISPQERCFLRWMSR